MQLSFLGWDDFFAQSFLPFSTSDFLPGRVALQHKHTYVVLTERGELTAVCAGRLLYESPRRADLPAVGDWVVLRPRGAVGGASVTVAADVHRVLPRRTALSRSAAGRPGEEQILACNVDAVFLMTGLDQNFSLRRIERYLAAVGASGAQPVVVLNKADLHPSPAEAEASVRAIARRTPVVTITATHENAVATLSPWLRPGSTVAVLGSSGVGKSTLINRLLGEDRLATRDMSAAVNKGRHTTTRREMVLTTSGAWVIDTPGMRELQLWNAEETQLAGTFDDLAQLVAQCRFRNCTHQAEPGCAVLAALSDGTLSAARWQSYRKLQRELAYEARRADPQLARENREHWKKIHREFRNRVRIEDDGE